MNRNILDSIQWIPSAVIHVTVLHNVTYTATGTKALCQFS